MTDTAPIPAPAPEKNKPHTSAIVSIVLGCLGIPLSIFVVGGLLGGIGFCVGLWSLLRINRNSAVAWLGTTFSAFAIIIAVGMIALFVYMQSATMEQIEAFNKWNGAEAPAITFATLDGEQVNTEDWKGERVLLNFWATWCPPCVAEMPDLNRLAQDANGQYKVYTIAVDEIDAVIEFVNENELTLPVAMMSPYDVNALPAPYGSLIGYPTTFIIDESGIIEKIMVGGKDYEAFREAILPHDVASHE